MSSGPEPQTHLSTAWIAMHNQAIDNTCSDCHTTSDAGGTSDTSFCSNSACHGTNWRYAGFDAPALKAIIQSQLPPKPTPVVPANGPLTFDDTIGPILKTTCGACHGTGGIKGLDLTSYQTTMAGGTDGPVIVPGDPDNSLLVKKQTGDTPHFGQLTPEQLKLVVDWIKAGAPEK